MTSDLRWESRRSAMMTVGVHRTPAAASATTRHSRTSEVRLTDDRAPAQRAAETSDEQRIVQAVLAGDRDAFRGLVDREGPSVVSACARVLGDRSEAEDVAQEAFVIAYRSLSSWRSDGSFGAWVSRIAVRLAVRRAVQRKRVTWLDPLAAEADQPGQNRFRLGGATDAVDPAHHVIRTERDSHLRSVVATLEEPYREVVMLRFFAERSLTEIAEATDRPLGTVKTHLHRGLARLRRALEEHDR